MNAPHTAAAPAPEAIFTLSVVAQDADIDELGHVSNVVYLRWVQEVALAHSAAVGLDVAAYVRLNGVFVVRRHEIDYLRPVLRGERLQLRTWIDSVAAAKSVRATEILRVAESGDGTVVARARTTWGFVEMTSGRPTRIPDHVRIAFGQPPVRPRA